MKKILILDVDSCYFCPCSSAEVGWLGNITRSVCQVKGKENTVYMDGVSGVPDWCPLKPMPEKLPEVYCDSMWWGWNKILDRMIEEQIKLEDFAKGWNACLEEVEK